MTLFLKLLFKNTYLFLKNRHYREFLRLAFLYGDKKRYAARKIRFLKYRFHVPDCLSFIWQFKEIFTDEYYFFSRRDSSPLIYDCGANIGTSCAYFALHYPDARIKAFEADPVIASILRENLLHNQITGVEVFDKAVWIHHHGIELSPEGSDGASIYGEGTKITVPSVRLKDLLLREDSIDMLKMDIEGAETEVLKDCREALGKVRNMFIEYHSYAGKGQELNELLAILSENRFRYTLISPYSKPRPLVNTRLKTMHGMDLQLNIFAYRTDAF